MKIRVETSSSEELKEIMQKLRFSISPDEIQEIINLNTKIMSRVPVRYENINYFFRKRLRKFYFQILDYMQDKKFYPYWRTISFHIETEKLVALRKKSGFSTANRYINFLCAMGLFGKHSQMRYGRRTNINKSITNRKPNWYKPTNTFYIFSYTRDKLDEIEERCKILRKHGISPSNIGKDVLILSGLENIAKELYFDVTSAIKWKDDSYERIEKYLDLEIFFKGYATKQDVIENVILNKKANKSAVNKVLSQYSSLFNSNYRYSRPTRKEKEEYNLMTETWIIRKRDEK